MRDQEVEWDQEAMQGLGACHVYGLNGCSLIQAPSLAPNLVPQLPTEVTPELRAWALLDMLPPLQNKQNMKGANGSTLAPEGIQPSPSSPNEKTSIGGSDRGCDLGAQALSLAWRRPRMRSLS